MTHRLIVRTGLLTTLLGAGLLAALPAAGVQDGKPAAPAKSEPAKAEPAKPAADPAADPMHEAWIKAATPGEEHKLLARFVGTWDAKMSMWMMPGAEPSKVVGTSVNTMVMGGRWLKMEWKASSPEMGEWEGLGYSGYDNITKKWTSTWMDSMSTGIMVSTGEYDAAKKTWTHMGEFKEPTGATIKLRQVLIWVNDNEHTFDMYMSMPGPDGKPMEFKSASIAYTRKK